MVRIVDGKREEVKRPGRKLHLRGQMPFGRKQAFQTDFMVKRAPCPLTAMSLAQKAGAMPQTLVANGQFEEDENLLRVEQLRIEQNSVHPEDLPGTSQRLLPSIHR